MSRNGSGIFEFTATSVAPAVDATIIDADAWNTTRVEIGDALTQSLSKDGQTVITGAIDFDANELILDLDGDTSITADTDDQIDFKMGGTDIHILKTVASAVNGLTLTGSATTVGVDIASTGSDTNIDIIITPKGTGEMYSITASANEIIKQQVFS